MPLEFHEISSHSKGFSFDEIARSIFKQQFENSPSYQNYCLSLNRSPKTVSFWTEIPALPTDAYKVENLPVRTHPNSHHSEVFYTSGTSKDIRGSHFFPEVGTYENSILAAWDSLDLPSRKNLVFLSQNKKDAPHSSLVHMFETMRKAAEMDLDRFLIDSNGQINSALLESFINQRKAFGLCGTALAFLHLIESKHLFPLPPGSWILETGGYKGTQYSLSKEELYQKLTKTFSISPDNIINEYSMTELSSQFYTRGLDQTHCGPEWTRVRVVDPETDQEVAIGEAGYLSIYDLANVHSVLAIRTQDIAIRTENPRTFYLIGRDPHAIARGCSRASDELLSNPS